MKVETRGYSMVKKWVVSWAGMSDSLMVDKRAS